MRDICNWIGPLQHEICHVHLGFVLWDHHNHVDDILWVEMESILDATLSNLRLCVHTVCQTNLEQTTRRLHQAMRRWLSKLVSQRRVTAIAIRHVNDEYVYDCMQRGSNARM